MQRQNRRARKIKTVSVLGSGWLGLPLAEHLISQGYSVKASTRSDRRLERISVVGAEPFIVDTGNINDETHAFLDSEILIINITSKDIAGFSRLLSAIEKSETKKVLFVSSTSVYEPTNTTIYEADNSESNEKPLFIIENLFRNNTSIDTTIIRFAGLIGYTRKPGRFFASGKTVKDPDAFVNLIHRDDCIAIMSRIIEQEIWGEVFNCCADSHPTKREFYTKAAQLTGNKIPEFENPDKTAFKIISNKKVKERLNYEFIHADLMQTLEHKGA